MSWDHLLGKMRLSIRKVGRQWRNAPQKVIAFLLFWTMFCVTFSNVSHGFTPRPQYHNGMEHFAGDFLFYSEDDRLCEIFDAKNWNENRGIPRPGAKDIELVEFAKWRQVEIDDDLSFSQGYIYVEEDVEIANDGRRFVVAVTWGYAAGSPTQGITVFDQQAVEAIENGSVTELTAWRQSFYKESIRLSYFGTEPNNTWPRWYEIKKVPDELKSAFQVIDPRSLYTRDMTRMDVKREITTLFKYDGRVYFFTRRTYPRPPASIEDIKERAQIFRNVVGITNTVTGVVYEYLGQRKINEICLYSGLPVGEEVGNE